MAELWGEETRKAIENFPVSGEPMPTEVITWLARIKAAAAVVNRDLGLLDGELAGRIEFAAGRIVGGEFADQFPVDVFQTGSGTSTNMNVNEVIAHLAGPDVHPIDHVNLGQSSNDVVPSAVHLAAVDSTVRRLLPALRHLRDALATKADEFAHETKAGRTHLMDAVPMTLGQEFGGYAAQMQLAVERITSVMPRVAAIPLGGTAVGTGLNTHREFGQRVRAGLAVALGQPSPVPLDRFEAQASRDSLVELSGVLRVVAVSLTKIANDIAWLGSGPRAGLGEVTIPELQKGSSIMPGKVNPVMAEVVLQVAAQVVGNDAAIAVGGMQGNFELNVRVPLIARNLLSSINLLTNATMLFADRCVAGITANSQRLRWFAEHSLATATALNPIVGYDMATAIVRHAEASGLSIRAAALELGVAADALGDALDPDRIAVGNQP